MLGLGREGVFDGFYSVGACCYGTRICIMERVDVLKSFGRGKKRQTLKILIFWNETA